MKAKYLSVCIFFLYTVVSKVPSSYLVINTSRKGSFLYIGACLGVRHTFDVISSATPVGSLAFCVAASIPAAIPMYGMFFGDGAN